MSDPSSPPDAFVGETLLGRYLVEECVARGGFAVVYRARHLELDVPVAIKALTDVDRYGGESGKAYLALFKQEARTVAALNHPAIVRVLDYGALGDRPWIAMEWLDGTTLEEDLRAHEGIGRSPREVLDLLRPAFDALACAHEAGVSHRDIKPSNLMLVKARRGEGSLRVIDFGVAKVDEPDRDVGSGSTRTAAAFVAFSTQYAAPEQVARTRTGPWTDVHALALVLVEALVGHRAYGDADGAELIERVLTTPRPTPARCGRRRGALGVRARARPRTPARRAPASAAVFWTELASSVEEAQAAWVASPRARTPTSNASSAVTRVGTGETAASLPSVAIVVPAPTTSTASLRASLMPPLRGTWLVAASLFVALAALATSCADLTARRNRRRCSSTRPSRWPWSRSPPLALDRCAHRGTAGAASPAVEARRASALRPRPITDASTAVVATPPSEPTLVVE